MEVRARRGVEAGAGHVQEGPPVRMPTSIARRTRPRRAARARVRRRGGCPGCARGRCRSPRVRARGRSGTPSRPQAVSLAVPSPPTASTISSPAGRGLGAARAWPGAVGDADLEPVARCRAARQGARRARAAVHARRAGSRWREPFMPPRVDAQGLVDHARVAEARVEATARPACPMARAPARGRGAARRGPRPGRPDRAAAPGARSRRPRPPPGCPPPLWPRSARPKHMASSRLVPKPSMLGRQAEDRRRRAAGDRGRRGSPRRRNVGRGRARAPAPRRRARSSPSPDDHEARLGDTPEHASGRGLEQGGVVLVLGERGHVADHAASGRDAQGGERLRTAYRGRADRGRLRTRPGGGRCSRRPPPGRARPRG